LIAAALALAAALSWAVSDFLGGLESRRLQLLSVLVLSQCAGLASVALLVLASGDSPPSLEHALYAAVGGAAGSIGIASFYRGMAIGAMSVVAPVSALAAIVPFTAGLIQGERPSGLQYAGVVLALGGGMLASHEHHEERGPGIAAGVGLALVAAGGFGIFFVAVDAAQEASVAWTVFFVRLTSTLAVLAVAAAVRPRLRYARIDVLALVAVGVLDMVANALFALATSRGYVSLVSVLASLYPVAVIALARIFLGERVAPVQAAGGLIALAGVALISAG
jgi:drug/metabolite transporter (DMT)-like permease